MPTYDYRCRACGHALEIFHSISEPARRKCPKCGRTKLERRIGTGAGFIFRGSGFYQTDYRSESYRQGAKADTPGEKPPTEGAPSKDGAAAAGKTPAESGTAAEGKTVAETKPSQAEPARKPKGGRKKRED